MTEHFLRDRWKEPEFVRSIGSLLEDIFRNKNSQVPADLRGLVVGLDGALPGLSEASFQDTTIAGLDASSGKFSCDFVRAKIQGSRFVKVRFDTCWSKGALFEGVTFDQARFESPTFDDAVFRGCSFLEARITGRGYREYGGRRAVFENCDFSNTVFRNLQFRACQFRRCAWEGTTFTKCLIVGSKFEETSPSESSFIDCGSS
jgi:uncharacterized protein YjbI with pentapeptide repeats